MSCSCSCSSKTLKIYKGFPTTFDNVPFLTVKTDSTIDIKGWKAKFIIDDVVKTYDSLQDGFSVSLTAEETATLKNGMRSASIVLIDAQGNDRPVITDIPCLVSEWVEGDVLIDDFTCTVSLKVDETTLELNLYGAQPDVAVTAVMDAKIEQHNTSETAHADIRSLIQDEATQRSDADADIRALIQDEATQRSDADADIRALIQDEATQRSDADNALSDRITSNYNQIDAINDELDTYGNIVTHNVNEFATAPQGIKADTALQPQDLAPYRTAEAQDAIDATKQDVIPDLDTIREDATTGAGLKTQVETNTENIATINNKIPTQASTTNQLADKDYVDNSVNNVSAFYITKNAAGDQFATKAELDSTTVFYSGGVVRVPTRNDYCIVASDETHDDARTRYTYQNGQWEFQYEVNERPFTSEEVAALESGITSDLVNQYSEHVANISNPHKVNKTQVGLESVKNVDATNASNISSGTLSNDRLGTIPYEKLSGVQATIPDLDTIRSDATAGKNASNTISTYGNIVTHNANEFATAAQGAKADTAVQPGAIADMATETWVKQQGYLTSTSLSEYATQEWVLGKGYITEAALLPYAKTADVNTALSGKQDSLTTSQLAAVNSGINANLVAQIGTNKTSIETLQTSKQDKLTAGANIDITDNVISATGVLGYSQITNCITEIPQDIKLELNNGTLTLKAGSKVYVPNGVGKFDEVMINGDIILSKISGISSKVQCVLLYYPSDNLLKPYAMNSTESGDTRTKNSSTFYNTSTNIIQRYDNNNLTVSGLSLPIAIITGDKNSITSIDQVFNGFGYIGSTVFALPGVKGLIPNGRNTDSSLKNIEYIQNKVAVYTGSSLTGVYNMVSQTNGSIYPLDCYYNNDDNTIKQENGNLASNRYIFGTITLKSGRITSLQPKTTFHAVDYNDFTATKDDIMALSESKQDKLTTSQLTAVNSGITSALVAQIGTNKTSIETLQTSKQDTLVSGTNIKTVNGKSLLGSGNVVVVQEVSELPANQDPNILYVIPVVE